MKTTPLSEQPDAKSPAGGDSSSKRHIIIGKIIGWFLGFLFLPILTILTIIIPIPQTVDLVLLMAFAPFGYLAQIICFGILFGYIGSLIGAFLAAQIWRQP